MKLKNLKWNLFLVSDFLLIFVVIRIKTLLFDVDNNLKLMLKKINSNKNIKALLGPTNTGKTFFAIEKMLNYPTGMIGLPLRSQPTVLLLL